MKFVALTILCVACINVIRLMYALWKKINKEENE